MGCPLAAGGNQLSSSRMWKFSIDVFQQTWTKEICAACVINRGQQCRPISVYQDTSLCNDNCPESIFILICFEKYVASPLNCCIVRQVGDESLEWVFSNLWRGLSVPHSALLEDDGARVWQLCVWWALSGCGAAETHDKESLQEQKLRPTVGDLRLVWGQCEKLS